MGMLFVELMSICIEISGYAGLYTSNPDPWNSSGLGSHLKEAIPTSHNIQ